jgi:hypothetical protein
VRTTSQPSRAFLIVERLPTMDQALEQAPEGVLTAAFMLATDTDPRLAGTAILRPSHGGRTRR